MTLVIQSPVIAALLGLAAQGDAPAPFGPQLVDLPVQVFGPQLVACDLDGDGTEEVLVSGAEGALVHATQTASGALAFQTASVPTVVRHVAVADLDGDGLQDVVVAGKHLFVLQNAGGFELLQPPWVTAIGSHDHVAAADVDLDGDLDLIATDEEVLRVYGNDGSHGFQLLSEVVDGTLTSAWTGFAHGDWDGDGVVDVARLVGNTVRVRRGDGAGGWSDATATSVGNVSGPVRAGDVDGDGDLDLLVKGENPFVGPRLLLGVGDGSFVDGPPLGDDYHALYSLGADLLDLDADGRSELLVGDAVGCFRLDDAAGRAAVTRWPFASVVGFAALRRSPAARPAVVGLVEIEVHSYWLKTWGLCLYPAPEVAGGGGFLDGIPVTQTLVLPQIDADVNGDGLLDRLSAPEQDGVWTVELGSPGGWTGGTYDVDLGEDSIRVLDANGDGAPDVLGRTHLGGGVFRDRLHINDGAGGFRSPLRFAPGLSLPTTPGVLGDLDGDGDDDVGVLDGGLMKVLLNAGDGTVALGASLPAVQVPKVVADLDGDGALDWVLPNEDGEQLVYGDGQGGVRGVLDAPALGDGTTRVLAAGDLDGDGLPDLITRLGGFYAEAVAVHPNLGGGLWGAPELLPGDRRAKFAAVADVDGDGRADLVLHSGLTLSVLRSVEGRGLVPWSRVAWRTGDVLVHDVDGDGRPELIGRDGILTRGRR